MSLATAKSTSSSPRLINIEKRHINGATAGGLNTLTSRQNNYEASRLNDSPGPKGKKQTTCSTKDANSSSPYWNHSKDSEMHHVAAATQDDDVLELKEDSHTTSMPGAWLSIEDDCHTPSTRLHKRPRTLNPAEMPTPHIKRSKIRQMESVESEDELGNGQCEQRERKTTPSGVVSPRRRAYSRGDIQPTQFGNFLVPPRAKDAQAGSYDIPDLAVRRAVSGKHFYAEDDELHGPLILQQLGNSATLAPKSSTQDNPTLKWMTLALDSVKSIEHAMTESKYVHIIRPRGNSFGADLWLEFADFSDVTSLIKSATNVESCTLSHDRLQTRYNKAMDTAESFAAAKRNQRTQKRRLSGSRTVPTELDETVLTTQRETRKAAAGGPRQERIIDKLNKSAATETNNHTTTSATNGDDDNSVSVLPIARRTRRSSPMYAPRELSPDLWTSRNPEWQKSWHRSLIFPPTGKNRATVDEVDIARLDEGQFLNDNLISFYIRYLQFKLEHDQPHLLKKVYIFSTFFFEKLTSTRGKSNFEGVKAWTAKFDLLSYDYIVVPVNENAHWYLAIICNTPNAVNGIPENTTCPRKEEDIASPGTTTSSIAQALSDVSILDDDTLKLSANEPTGSDPCRTGKALQQSSPAAKNPTPRKLAGVTNADTRLPKIVTLDSLGSPHAATCKALKEYLIAEAKDKKGVDLAMVPTGMTAKRIPEQNNLCDCGVFVLGYMEEFLKDPDETARKLVQKEPVNWNIRPSLLRNQVRNLLFELQDEQQEQLRKKAIQRQSGAPKNTGTIAAAHDSIKDAPKTPSSPLIEDPSTDDNIVKAHEEKFSPSNVTSVNGLPSTPLAPRRRSRREASHRASARKRAPIPATRLEQPPDNNLIHIIPSSPSEVEGSIRMTTPMAQSPVSPELVTASPRRSTGQNLRQSEENRTVYDGIDLSVNST